MHIICQGSNLVPARRSPRFYGEVYKVSVDTYGEEAWKDIEIKSSRVNRGR